MKVLKCRLEGFDDQYAFYANDAKLVLLVDQIPQETYDKNEKLVSSPYLFTERDGLYYAEHEGSVHFYYHNGKPEQQDGFGGSRIDLRMQDGSTKVLKGPWSSSAGAVNARGFTPCLDVTITDEPEVWERGYTFYASHITLTLAQEAAKLYRHAVHKHLRLVFLRVVEYGSYVTYQPALVKDSNSDFAGMVLDSGMRTTRQAFSPEMGTDQVHVVES